MYVLACLAWQTVKGPPRKPQRSAELAAGQVEHRTGEDGSAAALEGLACRDRRFGRGCGGSFFFPAPLTTEGDSLLPAEREGGGWVGATAVGGPALLQADANKSHVGGFLTSCADRVAD